MPRGQRFARIKFVKLTPRDQHRLLKQVFGDLNIAGEGADVSHERPLVLANEDLEYFSVAVMMLIEGQSWVVLKYKIFSQGTFGDLAASLTDCTESPECDMKRQKSCSRHGSRGFAPSVVGFRISRKRRDLVTFAPPSETVAQHQLAFGENLRIFVTDCPLQTTG